MSLSDYELKRRKELKQEIKRTGLDDHLDDELEKQLVKGLNNQLTLLETVNIIMDLSEKFDEVKTE